MNAVNTQCPPESMLSDFGLGKLDAASAESVSQHLETCNDCRRRVASVSGDSFVGRLRDARPKAAARDHTFVPGQSLASRGQDSGFGGQGITSGESLANAANSTDGSMSPNKRDGLASPSSPSAPPELANHPDFELVKELGQGGMGTVYLARNRMMDRLEVLKVISTALLDRPGALERFQQEIRSAAKLNHPNIVAAHSVSRPGNLLVFAMEYVRGQDLAQVVKARGPLPVANAAFYAHQVALGLQHAHEKGMVHRDIKPNNLMLTIEGKKHVVKILDFGLSKATSEKGAESGLTKSGQMLGTPDYIAPEQTLDAHQADIRADIYSLGCTLYALLSGGPPFQESSLYGILEAHQKREARLLNLVRPEVPAELAAVVAKMMAKNPQNRYQTPQEVARALVPFFKPGQSAPPPSPTNASHPPSTGETAAALAATTSPPLPAPPIAVALPMAARIAMPLPPADTAESVDHFSLSIDTQRPAASRGTRSSARRAWRMPHLPRYVWAILAGLLPPVVLLIAGLVFSFKTSEGTVVVEVNVENPEILIDGDRATVTWEDGGKRAEISLAPGTHEIELSKDGFKAYGKKVAIEKAGQVLISARLKPARADPEETNEPQPSLAGAAKRIDAGRERVATEAAELVESLSANLPLKADVIESIKQDKALSRDLREEALRLAGAINDDANRLNLAAWAIAVRRDAAPDEYRRALRWAEAACRIEPDDGNALNTLGVARYRAGQLEQALTALTQSAELNEDDGQPHPADVAFLALAHHALGHTADAQMQLQRLRDLAAQAKWQNDAETKAFLAEAEEVIGAMGNADASEDQEVADDMEPSDDGDDSVPPAEALEPGDAESDQRTDAKAEKTQNIRRGKPINLLKQLNLKQPGTVGDWRMERGRLIFPQIESASLAIFDRPPEEYVLTAVVQCQSHAAYMGFGVVVGNSQALVSVDGYEKQGSGMALIGGLKYRENGTYMAGTFLKDGKSNVVECTVRNNRVQLSCNGQTLFDWTGDPSTLSLPPAYADGRHQGHQLFICQGKPSPFVVTKLTLTPLGAAAEKPSPKKARAKNGKRAAGETDGWVPLFNGKDLTGWYEPEQNKGTWQVIDGMLVGRGTGTKSEGARLASTRQDLTDFQLRFDILRAPPQMAQVVLRAPAVGGHPYGHDGYRVALTTGFGLPDEVVNAGTISRAVGIPLAWTVLARDVRLAAPYLVEIHVAGRTITTFVDGAKAAEYKDADNLYSSGRIRLDTRYDGEIAFRRIEIKEERR